MAETGFADWRLEIDGLVANPMDAQPRRLRRLPARTQITRHDCVEGWSAIGKWTGPQLGGAPEGRRHEARRPLCRLPLRRQLWRRADKGGAQSIRYYESIDLVDAFHPQTILAHSMNGAPLPVGHGAPLRLRVERQLGYKQAKYVMRIEVVDSLDRLRQRQGRLLGRPRLRMVCWHLSADRR